jgi:glutathione synthase/RimK-type ligase-like ATP-grasp enzyme
MPPLIGFAALMRQVFEKIDLKPIAAELTARAEADPHDANALLDLSTILQLSLQHDLAMQMQAEALSTQRIFRLSAAQQPVRIRLLALMGAGDLLSNTPIECLVERSDIALDLLYISEVADIPDQVPDHDVLFIAIGESQENIPLLQALAPLRELWPRPLLNSPERIAELSRDRTCQLLSDISGLVMPPAIRLARHDLLKISDQQLALSERLARTSFPIIIRPLDSHAGRGLEKITQPIELKGYCENSLENEFYISQFIDYRSADGQFRKYRIVLIEGVPFVCHLAISSHWMIHYLNAGMADSAEKRAEEARCFATFEHDFAQRHVLALQQIYQRMGLDYVGIDCAEMPNGELLIFEVDSNMIVHAFDSIELFSYKAQQMNKVFSAFRSLLLKTAEQRTDHVTV